MPRISVRHVIPKRPDRGGPWWSSGYLADRDGRRIASRYQSGSRGFDVAFDTRDLTGEQQIRPRPRLPRLAQHRRAVDVRVAVNYSEAHEFRPLEAGQHPENAGLLAPFELSLKT